MGGVGRRSDTQDDASASRESTLARRSDCPRPRPRDCRAAAQDTVAAARPRGCSAAAARPCGAAAPKPTPGGPHPPRPRPSPIVNFRMERGRSGGLGGGGEAAQVASRVGPRTRPGAYELGRGRARGRAGMRQDWGPLISIPTRRSAMWQKPAAKGLPTPSAGSSPLPSGPPLPPSPPPPCHPLQPSLLSRPLPMHAALPPTPVTAATTTFVGGAPPSRARGPPLLRGLLP
jgi:hypothetical protein